ncbi:MAG: archease [Planctomycetes bacterium]|nr:archease [Planctomycetota bacterium]
MSNDDRGSRPAPTAATDDHAAHAPETFAHGADIGVRGHGPTLAAAFAAAAVALTSVVTDPAGVRPTTAVEIRCRAPDAELLLFEWLNALVYEMATRRMLFSRYEVAIDGDELHALAFGEPVDRERHQPTVEVKGATCTELRVQRAPPGWVAQCVVDV